LEVIKKIPAKLNHLLWETLEAIKPFNSSKICFFSFENIYNRLPGLAFNFRNGILEDYVRIQTAFSSFNGNEKWICYKAESLFGTKNYFIETEASYKMRQKLNDQIDIQKHELKELVDRILDDYPSACNFLRTEIQRTTAAL
jgi:hypothetical protein